MHYSLALTLAVELLGFDPPFADFWVSVKAHCAVEFYDDVIVAEGEQDITDKALNEVDVVYGRQSHMEAAHRYVGLIVNGNQGKCTVLPKVDNSTRSP